MSDEEGAGGTPNSGEQGGSGIPGFVIWIGLLLGVNGLSWMFDWPFWIY
jgi:hypothetical protein